jgi:acyl-CoA reductase-like NAD-dependent aldehyde dehydrogenase
VSKELAYVTEAMGLDAQEQKHWYYKLKREYEEEARLLAKIEHQKARKEFRKLMKQADIKKTLEEIDDYNAFYDKNEKLVDDDNQNAHLFQTKKE